jgi:sialate O-acetylesterase
VTFSAQKAGGPHGLVVKGSNEISRSDILFGEVWVCSGQSNMGWSVGSSRDGDLEALLCEDSNLRLITISNKGSQEKHKDVQGTWTLANSQSVPRFSAVGYYFGRELRRALNVPVGLINNAWGGSACEAWVPRAVLTTDKRNDRYVKAFAERVAGFDEEKTMAAYQKKLEAWKLKAKKARADKTAVPRAPRKPQNPRFGQHRPANLYNTRINPLLGYGIKGAIWYQGENNTNDNRSYGYRYLLPMMIKTWRKDWGVGDFSFYWSQLADFAQSRDADGYSPWAEMRESMTVAMQTTPKTGQAVITDLGEDTDIHPRKKVEVAKRLVRWALVKDYGFELECSSPMYKSHEIKADKVTLQFDHIAGGLRVYDFKTVTGFTIAGADQKFVPAQAKIMGDKIQVCSDQVKVPVAVRYAWAGNPECNIYSKIDLPLTPFRTDNWKLGSQID